MLSQMDYDQIQYLKSFGLKRSQVARRMGIHSETVNKYWEMTNDEFIMYSSASSTRSKKPDEYKDLILDYIRQFPDVSTAQVYHWLQKNTEKDHLEFSERTLRNYVSALRQAEDLPKPKAGQKKEPQ